MSGIQSVGHNLAMDGHPYYPSYSAATEQPAPVEMPIPDASDVAKSLAENIAQAKLDVQELQKIADAMGKKLRFNVNEELGRVVVKIVDPSTDKVLREIPSADMQQLQIKIRQTIGMLIDEKV